MKINREKNKKGFSLVEVALALAIVAVIVPALIGMLNVYSDASLEVRDRDDLPSLMTSARQYIAREPFSEVYSWVTVASTPKVLYAYRRAMTPSELDTYPGGDSSFTISQNAPNSSEVSQFDGRIMAIQIGAAETNILPSIMLPPNTDDYEKGWLPFTMNIHVIRYAGQELNASNFVESYPAGISR